MKILSNRQYNELIEALMDLRDCVLEARDISRIQQQLLEEAQEHALNQDFALKCATQSIRNLQDANLENLREMEGLAAIAVILRSDPDAEIGIDLDGTLLGLRDKVALIEEHKT